MLAVVMTVMTAISCTAQIDGYNGETAPLSFSVCVGTGKSTLMTGSSPDADSIRWTYTLVPADGGIGTGAVTSETEMESSSMTVNVSRGTWRADVFGYRDEAYREPVYAGSGTGYVSATGGTIAVTAVTMTDASLAGTLNPSDTPKITADIILLPIGLDGDESGTLMKHAEWSCSSTIISSWTASNGIWTDDQTGLEIPSAGLVVEVPCGASRNVVLTIKDSGGNIIGREGWSDVDLAMNCVYQITGNAAARVGGVEISVTVQVLSEQPRTAVSCGSVIDSFFSVNPSSEMPSDTAVVLGYRIRKKGDPAAVLTSDLSDALTYPCTLYIPGVEDKDTYTPSELGLTVLYAETAEEVRTSGASEVWAGKSATALGNLKDEPQSSVRKVAIVDGATLIGSNMFYGNGTVEEVIIPQGVTRISNYAFQGCTALKAITLPNTVTTIKTGAFADCTSLTDVILSENITQIPQSCFLNCTSLQGISIPEKVTSLSDASFRGCTSLVSVVIPGKVTALGASCFRYCSGLSNVIFSEGSPLSSIGTYAFQGCGSLTDIILPDGVKSIGAAAFQNCTSLISMSLPSGITTVTASLFSGCTGLERIEIGNLVTSIGSSAFMDCASLKSAEIPAGVKTMGESVFQRCTGLESITLPSGITSIPLAMFSGCIRLRDVTIPGSVTVIDNFAFTDCTSLSAINIPEGVDTVGVQTFQNCTGLTGLLLPSSVTSVGSFAFSGCSALSELRIDREEGSLDLMAAGLPESCSILWKGQF